MKTKKKKEDSRTVLEKYEDWWEPWAKEKLVHDKKYWKLSTKNLKKEYLRAKYKLKLKDASIIVDFAADLEPEKSKRERERKKQKEPELTAQEILALPEWKEDGEIYNYVRLEREVNEKKEEYVFKVWQNEKGTIHYKVDNNIQLPPDTPMSQQCFNKILKTKKLPKITLKELYLKFKDKQSKYFFADDIYYITSPLKSLSTYFYEVFNTITYSDVFSPEYGSGKTRLAMVIAWCSFHGIFQSDPTAAVLFRIMKDVRCTIGIDEVDKLNPKTDADIIAIVNSSNTRGIKVPRMNMETNKIEHFDAFGMKLFTRVGNMPDKAWISRCDPISMTENRGRKKLKKTPIPDDFKDIRDLAYILRWKYMNTVYKTYNELFEEGVLKDRNRDIFLPMLTIAKLIDEDIYQTVLEYAKEQWLKTSYRAKDQRKELLVRILYSNENFRNDVKVKDIRDTFNEALDKAGMLGTTKGGALNKYTSQGVISILENLNFERSTKHTDGYVHFDIVPKILEENVLVYNIIYDNMNEFNELNEGKTDGTTKEGIFAFFPDKNEVGEEVIGQVIDNNNLSRKEIQEDKKSTHTHTLKTKKKTSLSSLSSKNEQICSQKIEALVFKLINNSPKKKINGRKLVKKIKNEGFDYNDIKIVLGVLENNGKIFQPQSGVFSYE